MDTAEFIGSDHKVHVADSNGNLWPPILGSTSNITDLRSKQISDRPNMTKGEEKIKINRVIKNFKRLGC